MDFKMFCTGEYMRKIKDAYTDDIIYATSQCSTIFKRMPQVNLLWLIDCMTVGICR